MSEQSYNCILVRHCETDWNVQDRYSGQSNEPMLTREGVIQAYELGKQLRGEPIRKIVCSDLRRARATALALSWHLEDVPIIADARLRELSVGEMDGLAKAEARERFSAPRFATRHPDYDFRPIGGECREEVIRRHREAFYEHSVEDGVGVFVGHGTALRSFLESCGVTETIVQGGFVRFLCRGKPSEMRTLL